MTTHREREAKRFEMLSARETDVIAADPDDRVGRPTAQLRKSLGRSQDR
jgi:hypothetical protein